MTVQAGNKGWLFWVSMSLFNSKTSNQPCENIDEHLSHSEPLTVNLTWPSFSISKITQDCTGDGVLITCWCAGRCDWDPQRGRQEKNQQAYNLLWTSTKGPSVPGGSLTHWSWVTHMCLPVELLAICKETLLSWKTLYYLLFHVTFLLSVNQPWH